MKCAWIPVGARPGCGMPTQRLWNAAGDAPLSLAWRPNGDPKGDSSEQGGDRGDTAAKDIRSTNERGDASAETGLMQGGAGQNGLAGRLAREEEKDHTHHKTGSQRRCWRRYQKETNGIARIACSKPIARVTTLAKPSRSPRVQHGERKENPEGRGVIGRMSSSRSSLGLELGLRGI